MSLIVLDKIQKSYKGEFVLRDASLVLNKGDKVGLVGRNGCGKTTLLCIAAGIVSPDAGTRTAAGNMNIGMLEQTPDFGGAHSVLEAASGALIELNRIEKEMARLSAAMDAAEGETKTLERLIERHERLEERYRFLGGYSSPGKVEAVLRGVGFHRDDFSKRPHQLSGGEAKRLQLAMVLLGGNEILLLDEPGNHLDLAGTEWLTDFLKEYRGTVLIISHDRYLLNGVVDQIVQLTDGRTHHYRGNYDFFVNAYAERAADALKKKEQQDKIVAKGEEYIRRNFYGQKARQAKSKRKMLDRLETVEVFRPEEYARFSFNEAALRGERVLLIDTLGASAGGLDLFQGLDLEVETGETLGIIGPNGCGKTTLLEIILGNVAPASGTCRLAPFAKAVYFDQQLKGISGSGTLLEEMRLAAPKATDGELRSHLARFLFKGDDVHKDLSALSGGERSKALLAKIVLQETNLLLLDEPTNHLDIYARETLEEALGAFKGTTLLVSHDRRLLDGIVDKLLVLGSGKPVLHLGNYSAYAERLKAAEKAEQARKAAIKTKQPSTKSSKKPPPQRIKRKHTYDELEALIIAHEERLREIELEIYKKEVYMDPVLSRKLEEEARTLKRELNDLYEEWDTWT